MTSRTTAIVSCQEYTSMSASAPNTSANEMIHAIPPHSVNCESVSTSAVTRATNTPRFSSVCSAIDRSWMCSNVRTRSAINACSDAFTSRRAARRLAR